VRPAQRLDKWLWFARRARSRALVQKLIADGGVRIGGKRVTDKAAAIHIGDVLTLNWGTRLAILRVTRFVERRGDAAAAASLFEDLTPDLPPPVIPQNAYERAIARPLKPLRAPRDSGSAAARRAARNTVARFPR
jgi:ribosome-associated heat shock protein Hsp15